MSFLDIFIGEYGVVIVLYSFLIIIFISLIAFCFNHRKQETLQKLIGGLAVFIVAIISQNPYVIFTSLFIGGLIIASENFMKALVAILRSKSEKIPETLSALLTTEKATDEEIEKERIKEIPKREIESNREYIRKLINAERLVLSYFRKRFGKRFESRVKISSPIKRMQFVDGVINDINGNPETIIEIKFLRNNKSHISFIKRNFLRKMKFFLENTPINLINLCFVLDEKYNLKQITEITKSFSEFKNLKLSFFEIKNNRVEPIFFDFSFQVNR